MNTQEPIYGPSVLHKVYEVWWTASEIKKQLIRMGLIFTPGMDTLVAEAEYDKPLIVEAT